MPLTEGNYAKPLDNEIRQCRADLTEICLNAINELDMVNGSSSLRSISLPRTDRRLFS